MPGRIRMARLKLSCLPSFWASLICAVVLANWPADSAEIGKRRIENNHFVSELGFVPNAGINHVTVNRFPEDILASNPHSGVQRFILLQVSAWSDGDRLLGSDHIRNGLCVIPLEKRERIGWWHLGHYGWAANDDLKGCGGGISSIYQGETDRCTLSHASCEIPDPKPFRLSNIENLERRFVEIDKRSQLGAFSMIGGISHSSGFFCGPECSGESKYQNDQVNPIEEIVLTALGAFIGIFGIYLALFIAPVRGDGWGFFGLALLVIGFFLGVDSRSASRHRDFPIAITKISL
jgi:hypothetical protein